MKALSLWQPWASLLVAGRKRCETRSWPIRHRGPLLIHAAGYWSADLEALCRTEPFRSALEAMGVAFGYAPGPNAKVARPALPFGMIVGRVNVIGCHPTDRTRVEETYGLAWSWTDGEDTLLIPPLEAEFGDYSPGRFAFLTRDPVRFHTRIPFRGRQGLFDVPDDLAPEVLADAG